MIGRSMTVIGLTGGIASGKSTVAKALVSFGAKIIDADILGHEVYVPDSDCYAELVAHFGQSIVSEDRTINRRALGVYSNHMRLATLLTFFLGPIVFSDPAQLEKLNQIVWPHIRTKIEQAISTSSVENVLVVEAAVLLEAGWQDIMSEIWVAAVDKPVAVERLMKRNNFSREEADKRINSQLTNEERTSQATVMIWNNGTEEELVANVGREWKQLQSRL